MIINHSWNDFNRDIINLHLKMFKVQLSGMSEVITGFYLLS